jgi:hypothetical protein
MRTAPPFAGCRSPARLLAIMIGIKLKDFIILLT